MVKKVIKGALYDTQKARLVYSRKSSDDQTPDFSLYITKSGKYFAETGDAIEALSRAEAISEVRRLEPDVDLATVFGDANEEVTVRLNAYISKRTHLLLKEEARVRGCSVGEVVELMVAGEKRLVDPEEFFNYKF